MKRMIFMIIIAVVLVFALRVNAEEAVEVASATWYEQILAFFESLGGLRTAIVSATGMSILVLVYKVLAIIKFARTDQFDSWLFERIVSFVNNLEHEKNRRRFEAIIAIGQKLPIVRRLAGEAVDAKNKLALELEGRLYDIEAKIKSGLFEGEELVKLVKYKAKLLDEIDS